MMYFLIVLAAAIFILSGILAAWAGVRSFWILDTIQFVVTAAALLFMHLRYVPAASTAGALWASFAPPLVMSVLFISARLVDLQLRRRVGHEDPGRRVR